MTPLDTSAVAMRILALLIALAFVPIATAVNDWPQQGYDETHQSRVPASANAEFDVFTLRWWNNLSIPARPGPAALRDNIVYLGDAAGNLHAFDRESGGKLWTSPTTANTPIEGTPAVGDDAVYVLGSKGSIYAFDRKTGAAVSGFPISVGGTALGSVLFHPQQNLLIAAAGSNIKAYFANSQEQKWTFSASGLFFGNATTGLNCQGGTIEGTPVLFEDYVFFGSTNRCFFAIDNRAFGSITTSGTGSQAPVWGFAAENSIRSSPAIDVANRRVLFGDLSGNMYAIPTHTSGKVTSATWSYKEPLSGNLPSEFKASASIVDDKAIVASRNGKVNALSLTSGAKVWTTTRDLGGEIVGTPAIANGKLLVGTLAGTMYMLNVSNGEIQDQRAANNKISVSPIISGTQGIWASDDGVLHSWGRDKPPRADLAVLSVSPSAMTQNQAVTISGSIKNNGVLAAPATTATISVDGQTVAEIDVAALEPGASASVSTPYTPTKLGKITLKIFVDPARTIPESDEANNEFLRDVTVARPAAPPGPDPTTSEDAPGPGIVALLAVAALAMLALRRRRRLP